MAKFKEAVVRRVEDRSPTVKSFFLELPDRDRLDFLPGQFLTLDLPISERRRERWRSYSIASAPDGTNGAELCVVHLEGGRGSTYLFEEVEAGSVLQTKEPGGVFTLPPGPLDFDLAMVCTGTGVAPFRSMLLDRLPRETRQFHLIFGCRREEDLLYREEFEALARKYDHFSYSVALSRAEELPEGLDATSGYVHSVYERQYATPRPDLRFYLCGWSRMVDEAKQRLLDLGYGERQVVLELYG